MISADPLNGRAVAAEMSEIVEPVGARRGTRSQLAAPSVTAMSVADRARGPRKRDIMKTITILVPMQLHGQATSCRGASDQAGYAMAALLVAMSIMAVMMTVVMPVWKQTAQREKETELVFRGEQYVHAITLFQRKFANAFPPNGGSRKVMSKGPPAGSDT